MQVQLEDQGEQITEALHKDPLAGRHDMIKQKAIKVGRDIRCNKAVVIPQSLLIFQEVGSNSLAGLPSALSEWLRHNHAACLLTVGVFWERIKPAAWLEAFPSSYMMYLVLRHDSRRRGVCVPQTTGDLSTRVCNTPHLHAGAQSTKLTGSQQRAHTCLCQAVAGDGPQQNQVRPIQRFSCACSVV